MLKYQSIAEDIRRKIQNGIYSPGSQVALEKEMCKEYEASRVTIKRAVDELVKQGLLVKRRGWGTYVKNLDDKYAKELSINASIENQFLGFSETFKDRDIKTKVLKFEVIHPPQDVASKLDMSVEDFVYDITRVRILEDTPFVVEYMMMPIQIIQGLRMETIEHSIYKYIESNLKLTIQSAHRTIRAVQSTELERQELKIDDKMPIFEVAQVAFINDGRPFEYSISHHRADKCTFSAVSLR